MVLRILVLSGVISYTLGCAASHSVVQNDARGNQTLTTIKEFKQNGCYIERIYVHATRPEIGLVASGSGRIEAFNLKVGDLQWQHQATNFSSRYHPVPRIRAMAFSHDGEFIVIGGSSYLAQLRSDNGQKMAELKVETPGTAEGMHYSAMAISHDLRFVAAVGVLGKEPESFDVNSIGVSPDHLARAKKQYDQVIEVWDSQSGKRIRHHSFKDSYIREIGFSADGSDIFTAGYNAMRFFRALDLVEIAQVSLSDLPTGNPLSVIISAAVSRDLRFVAISTLRNIHVVATESRRVIANFGQLGGSSEGIAGIARHIEFTNSDEWISATDLNGRYYSFEVMTGKLTSYGYSPRGDIVWSSGSTPHPLVSFDPERRFALEPIPFSEQNTCPGIRMIRLP